MNSRLIVSLFYLIAHLFVCSCSSGALANKSKLVNLYNTDNVDVKNMTLLVSSPGVDTDGNGFIDRVQVSTSLFGGNSAIPLIIGKGEFIFALYTLPVEDEVARPVALWRFKGERLSSGRTFALFGPTYTFDLNILDQMPDRQPSIKLNLKGWFDSLDGTVPIASSAQLRPITLGRDKDL